MSELEKDISAGMNGSFEITKNGLPVNWLMYTENTVPEAKFDISFDKASYKEGSQSLRFDVEECVGTGGWHSPGFTNEFFRSGAYEGPARYKLSFWIRNAGAGFRIMGGDVESKGGNMRVLIEDDKDLEDWEFLEYEMDIPEGRWLRFQLNIVKPGTFWIDDVQVQRL